MMAVDDGEFRGAYAKAKAVVYQRYELSPLLFDDRSNAGQAGEAIGNQ
jgi:hypothetical protein